MRDSRSNVLVTEVNIAAGIFVKLRSCREIMLKLLSQIVVSELLASRIGIVPDCFAIQKVQRKVVGVSNQRCGKKP